jgi:hypothetical protein
MPLRLLPRQEYSYSSLALQRDFPDISPSSGEQTLGMNLFH